jgi:hypothetical protein
LKDAVFSVTENLKGVSDPKRVGMLDIPIIRSQEATASIQARVKAYYDYYLDKLKEATGGLMGKRGLHYLLHDNFEVGQGNWTNEMMAEFKRRRGYDMTPWLPTLVGHVVESAEASDRFLWDFRKTIAEMTAELQNDPCNARLAQLLNAIAAYTAAHGDPPADLSALQPEYVAFEPVDPVSNQPYRYQTLGQSVSLSCPPVPSPPPAVAEADDAPGA